MKSPPQDSFFDDSPSGVDPASRDAPLAERCRPLSLDGYAGQEHILGKGKPLRLAIEQDRVPSMILWGPPGSGKTTLARLIAHQTQSRFVSLSATNSGAKELRSVVQNAETQQIQGARTILFIDEIHRWNKSRQDALLPHVESGLITLIGATTENPSFEVNSALLSRATVYILELLDQETLQSILQNGVLFLREEGTDVTLTDEACAKIAEAAQGDARVALNQLEQVVLFLSTEGKSLVVTEEMLNDVLSAKRLVYDKAGEEHYNLISALHKSMRGSDADATLYWLARMLESGEDPMYILRRIIRFASEDVGLADPNGLLLAIAARDAYHMLGSPEGDLAIAQVAVYLATAPKSNALYSGLGKAMDSVITKGYLPTPLHIRNAPTSLMKDAGYGKGYKYAHDFEDAFIPQSYLPEALTGVSFYEPTEHGVEKKIRQRMDEWKERIRKENNSDE